MVSGTVTDGPTGHRSGYLKSTDISPMFRIPFIHSRYRENGKPWHFYVRSLFGLHNETGNVWTHLLGALLLAIELWSFRKDFAISAPFDTAMVTLFGAFSVFLHLVSSGAHLLHSHSPSTHLLVCSCDYACVGIEGFVYNIVGYCFYSHENYYNAMRTFIVPISMTLSFMLSASMAFILASRKRNISGNLFRMMLIPAIAYFVIGLGPIWHKLLLLIWHQNYIVPIQGHHLLHPLALGLGFGFFISRFPERIFPGRFDLIGHSHQWFHIGVTLSEYFVIRGVRTDLLTKPSVLCSQRQQLFSIGQLWFSKSLLVVINLVYITLLYMRYHKKAE